MRLSNPSARDSAGQDLPMASRWLLSGLVFCSGCFLASQAVHGGVLFSDPTGGWDYTYEGDEDAFGDASQFNALDGLWRHDHGDTWDGSAPGDPFDPEDPGGNGVAPGGIGAFADADSTSFLRIQDAGDPTKYLFPDPSNRKLYLAHDIADVIPEVDPAVLDNGITISFRTRLSTDGPLDEAYPERSEQGPWPEDGKGYEVYGGGRGMFGVIQQRSNGDHSQISFSLMTEFEALFFGLETGGLTMNNLADVDIPDAVNSNDGGTKNLFSVEDEQLIEWREFWINISEASNEDTDTHEVKVYMDGSLESTSYLVTEAADQSEVMYQGSSFVALGMNSGTRFGAFDVDYLSYKAGVFEPGADPDLPGDFDADKDVDIDDVNALLRAIDAGTNDALFDLTDDQIVDSNDLETWVNDVKNTWFGDANLDGEFSTTDLVVALRAGEYEDGIAGNSTWEEGDWNGDLDFESGDLVVALSAGGFEVGPKAAAAAVPEPTSIGLSWLALLGLWFASGGRRRPRDG